MTFSKSSLVAGLILLFSSSTFGQVGIGTNSPAPSAQLEVRSTNKGFLPPSIALQGTNDAQLGSPRIASPATGLLVYNTATTGTTPNNVTPGFYYYDGAKWQRIINQQPDATISFNQNTPTTGGVVFTPDIRNSTDYIYVSSTNNSQWTYNGSAYVTYTPPASTPWMLSGGTTDAGSNKSDVVYRTGALGIGSNTTPNTNSLLDLNSTTKGFLPPRMTSTQRNTLTTPAGLVVYNSTDNRLDVLQNSTWRSLASLDGTETLTNKTLTTPVIASGSGQFPSSLSITPTTHATSTRASIWIDGWSLLQDVTGTGTKNFSIGQTVIGSPTTYPSRLFISTIGDIGIGNTAPIARLDIRTTPNSSSDPGVGYFGVGTTSTAANSAGAGALRYSTSNGGVLEYSNGLDWKPLAATKKVAVYTEVHADAGNTGWYSAGSAFNDFNTITADNVADVYPLSGGGFINGTGTGSSSDRWVAPFTGKFRITTNVYFNHNPSYLNPRVYAYKNNTTICNITSVNTGGQDIATCTSAIISMNQGDYINWKVEYNSQIWRGLYHTFFRIESVE